MHESTVYFLGEWPNTLLLIAYTTTQFISCCKQAGTLNVGENPYFSVLPFVKRSQERVLDSAVENNPFAHLLAASSPISCESC
jgi:hypothetical protein